MSKTIDVTDKVGFNSNDIDAELLPILHCICGKRFSYWEYSISIYDDLIFHPCCNCGARLYFKNEVRIYQVIDE